MDSSMAPPPHPEPNYINPPTRAPMVLATNITFTALSLIILLLRVYSRQTIHGQLNYEDFMCVIAWVCISLFTIPILLNSGTNMNPTSYYPHSSHSAFAGPPEPA